MRQKISKNTIKTLGLALVLACLITGCGKGCEKKDGVPAAKSSALSLIPSDNNVLVGINMKKLKDSPLGAKMKESLPEEMAPFVESIEGVTLGFSAKGMGKEPEGAVAIMEGSLDQEKLLAQLKEQAKKDGGEVTTEEYNGVAIHSGVKDPEVGMAFVESVAVVGQKPSVKKVIDLSQKKGESIEKNASIMELLKAVDSSKMIWAVASVPEGAIPGGGGNAAPGNPMGALSNIKALDLAMDMTDKLTLDLGIIANTEEDAKQMENMANSYKTLFGSSLAQKEPKLGEVLNNLNVSAEGPRVVLNLAVAKETVEELSKKAASAGMEGPMEGMDEGSGDVPPPAEDSAPAPDAEGAEPQSAGP